MHKIAQRAGVGKATVSLALRDDPRLRPETRRRIQKLAAKMGYRTNATVANLMAQLRASRIHRCPATLGLLNVSPDASQLSQPPFREWSRGCRERAGQLGYGLEGFWLHEPGSTPAHLAERLESHNIRGFVIAAPPGQTRLPEEFDPLWRRFACVVAGVRPVWPPLNFCSNDQFVTASQAAHHLWGFGYRRMALVISPEMDALAERRYSAGFWAAQEGLDGCERIPTFPFHPAAETAFRAWFTRHEPDVILCAHEEVRDWLQLMNLKLPGDVALAHLDWREDRPDWAGMHQNHTLVGAGAVDLLVGQLHGNEAGFPKFPKASFIQSKWIDGPTIGSRLERKRTRSQGKANGVDAFKPARLQRR